MCIMKSAYQAAGTSPEPRIGFVDRKNSGALKTVIDKVGTVKDAESTDWCRMPGSVAAVDLARILTNPGFDVWHPRNRCSCSSSNLYTLLPAYHSRPHSHLRFQTSPNPIPHSHRTDRQCRLKERRQTGCLQLYNRVCSKLRPSLGQS